MAQQRAVPQFDGLRWLCLIRLLSHGVAFKASSRFSGGVGRGGCESVVALGSKAAVDSGSAFWAGCLRSSRVLGMVNSGREAGGFLSGRSLSGMERQV